MKANKPKKQDMRTESQREEIQMGQRGNVLVIANVRSKSEVRATLLEKLARQLEEEDEKKAGDKVQGALFKRGLSF